MTGLAGETVITTGWFTVTVVLPDLEESLTEVAETV
jgi:hypothetical protein